MGRPSIVNVTTKVSAFWEDHERGSHAIRTSYELSDGPDGPMVVGHAEVVRYVDGGEFVLAEAYGSRAMRAPIPNAQGDRDTRDIDRAQTQAVGRALGLLGYFSGTSLEGNTDEPPPNPLERIDATHRELFDKALTAEAATKIEDYVTAHPNMPVADLEAMIGRAVSATETGTQ